MAVNIKETVLQGVRAFVKAAAVLTDAAVIVAGDAQPRAGMPYVAVQVLNAPGVEVGTDELMRELDGADLQEWTRGHRRFTVQLTAYGTDAAEYLEYVRMAIQRPSSREVLTPYGIGIPRALTPRGGMALRGTGFEESAVLDIEVTLCASTIPVDAREADSLSWDVTLDRENPPADLVASGTETL